MKLKKYLDFLDNKTIWPILRLYNETKGSYTGNHVSRLIKVNKVTTIKILEKLTENGVLDKEVVGASNYYSYSTGYIVKSIIEPLLDQEEKLFIYIKSVIYKKIKEHVKKAYIFGSYATGKETVLSDLDICLVVNKETDQLGRLVEELNNEFIDQYQIKISPYIVTSAQFNSKKTAAVINAIKKEGILLEEEENG